MESEDAAKQEKVRDEQRADIEDVIDDVRSAIMHPARERDEALRANARLRDDYRRLAESYKALYASMPQDNRKPSERAAVTAYEVKDFPYPREWELEDAELKRERDEAVERAAKAEWVRDRFKHVSDCQRRFAASKQERCEKAEQERDELAQYRLAYHAMQARAEDAEGNRDDAIAKLRNFKENKQAVMEAVEALVKAWDTNETRILDVAVVGVVRAVRGTVDIRHRRYVEESAVHPPRSPL